jgi:hypothetical protein
MWKCTEWTVNQTIPVLHASGVVTKWRSTVGTTTFLHEVLGAISTFQ